jgi:hypothetical protein
MKKEEKALHSQHIQISKLEERAKRIKDETENIVAENATGADQLQDMEKELAEMSALLGVNIENADLTKVNGLVELSEEEIASIEKRISIPPLDVVKFKDWNSFVIESDAFLKKEGVDPSQDPIFQMLSLTEMSEVLKEYKDNYGEIFLDWKDYAVVLLAGATGGLIDQFAPVKLKKHKLMAGANNQEFFQESIKDWKNFAKDQVSSQVGFNIDELQEFKSFVIKEISSKIGFDLEPFQAAIKYITQKVKEKQFVLTRDLIEVYRLIPEEWQKIANEWVNRKTGSSIDDLLSVQEYISEKIQNQNLDWNRDIFEFVSILPETWKNFVLELLEKKLGIDFSQLQGILEFAQEKIQDREFQLLNDSLEILDRFPESWKMFISGKLSDKIGFDIEILNDIKDFILVKIKENDFDIVNDGIELIEKLPEEWKSFVKNEIVDTINFDVSQLDNTQAYIREQIRDENFEIVPLALGIIKSFPDNWQDTINQKLSGKIGFDLEVMEDVKQLISEKPLGEFDPFTDGIEILKSLPLKWRQFVEQLLSEKLGFDTSILKDLQDFVLEKIQTGAFDLLEDTLALVQTLPEDWKDSIQEALLQKTGFDILATKDIQEFMIQKTKEGQIDILADGLELIQRLPEEWKKSINQNIAEKTGLDVNILTNSMGSHLVKLNQLRSNPADFISQQIQTYISGNEQLNALNQYFDMDRLSDVIVLVLDIVKTIFGDDSENNREKLGEIFQELLLTISDLLNPTKDQLVKIGGEVVLDKISNFKITATIFEIDGWIKNSGLNITIDDLLLKIDAENIDDTFTENELNNFSQLFSKIMSRLSDDTELSGKIDSLFSSMPVIKNFLNDQDSAKKLTTLLAYASTNSEEFNEEKFEKLAGDMVLEVQKKLDIVPGVLFDSGGDIFSDAAALGDWLHDNGLSPEHLKKSGLTAAIIEIIVRGWYLSSLYNETGTFKKESFAVKVSTMLASAHLFSNLPALVQVISGMPPRSVNFTTLGLGAKYALSAITEYAKREKQIQNDLDDKLTSIYKNSMTLL